MSSSPVQCAQIVIERVRALGVEPRPGSALQYAKDTIDGNGTLDAADAAIERLTAIKELRQLDFVLDGLGDCGGTGVGERLLAFLEHAASPFDVSPDRAPRVPWVLFVAAVCTKGGLGPVELEEPGLRAHLQGQPIGLAVASAARSDQVEAAVRGAADLVERAGLPGVIALETCMDLAAPDGAEGMSDGAFRQRYPQLLSAALDEIDASLQAWTRGKGVRGVVFHDSRGLVHRDGHLTLHGVTIGVCTAGDNQRRRREFATFHARYGAGLPRS